MRWLGEARCNVVGGGGGGDGGMLLSRGSDAASGRRCRPCALECRGYLGVRYVRCNHAHTGYPVSGGWFSGGALELVR